MNDQITIGTSVEFDTQHGPLRGTVTDVQGRIATIFVKNMQGDLHILMPMRALTAIAEAQA